MLSRLGTHRLSLEENNQNDLTFDTYTSSVGRQNPLFSDHGTVYLPAASSYTTVYFRQRVVNLLREDADRCHDSPCSYAKCLSDDYGKSTTSSVNPDHCELPVIGCSEIG